LATLQGPLEAVGRVLFWGREMSKNPPVAATRAHIQTWFKVRLRSQQLRLLAVLTAVVMAGALLAVTQAAPVQATCGNPIACENQLPGTPQSVWDVSSYSTTIQGFADPFSVNIGNSINFKIESPASSYKIDIYRMGYYDGDGARLITSLTPNIPVSQSQPTCNTNTVTGLVDCGNWGVSATWDVPSTAVSGVYFARIYRTDGITGANQIPFVVTDNSSHSNILFMTSDETWQAYNDWGGYSLYTGTATGSPWCCSALDPGRAVQVSYNRPFATRYDNISPDGQDFFFYAEFPMIQFLEKNGYDVSYVSQIDAAQPGAASMIEQHKVLINTGHSEYWDANDMVNITAARNAGVNLAFFTGNTAWWKTRWANSQYGNEPYRTLITYKESLDSKQSDPADPPTWTGAWRDPRFSPPGDASPENALTGQLWDVNCCSYADTVPSAYAKLRLWRNTAVSSLQPGQRYTMPNETLGYEWDSDIDNGFRPPGEIDMSQTCAKVQEKLYTVTEELVSDNACNSLTLYRAASGALVFDAGTVQWSWGLESDHDGDSQNPPDPVMQQATVNLLADMGVQPATLESDLTPAAQSTDHTPPSSTITSPSAGTTLANGSSVTITGTATDSGGGVVAGVEVSTDGGSTWHPVTTMSAAATTVNWSYTWSAAGSGAVTIKSRATDDSGNTETPGPGVLVTVNCPCSLFGASYTPYITSDTDSGSYELGMKFQSAVPGWVAGVRFYKGADNDGTHTGSLWTASGTLLATGTFTNETASGWQTLIFASPVQISANTTYVVSYYDPDGHYSVDEEYFAQQVNNPPLIGVKADYLTAGGGNGVFNPGGPGFPTQMNDSWSYSVDVIFDTTQPPSHPTVTSASPIADSSSDPVSTDPAATFSEPVLPSTVSFRLADPHGTIVPGTTSFNSADTVATFTPASSLAPGTTYTVTISGATDSSGEAMLAPYTYAFTASQAFDSGGKCPCAIWPDVAPSGVSDVTDGTPVELGLKFTASQNGSISGIRFYKVPDNTGTHTGSLWSSTGTLLATGTFTNESSQGWEEMDFSNPVPVTAGMTYVASYHTNAAHYADTASGLASAVTSGPLTAQANGGVYAYGSASTFPSNSSSATNYWVDVVYTTPSGTFSPVVSSVTPSSGSSGNPVTVAPMATFSQMVVPSTVSFTMQDSDGHNVAGSVSFNSNDTVATFTPTSPLAADTTYMATVSGAQNNFGTPMSSPFSWTFSTAGAQCPCSIWPSTAQPSVASASDTSAVNLGVQFTTSVNGWITGIRFYKGSGNTGTHIGSLWTSTGTLLGQVTFTNESASGWQVAYFSSPIPVTAGTTYVASYFAPNGGYSVDSAYFGNAGVTNGALTAPQSSAVADGNGVYAYGGSPAFPSSSFNATNYWVDVVFTEP
jgi:methionine-rich copper-binding protein CopC